MRLILFTNRFPYGLDETFIENEIAFLTSQFDDVTIIPLERRAYMRPLPSGAKLDSSLAFALENANGLDCGLAIAGKVGLLRYAYDDLRRFIYTGRRGRSSAALKVIKHFVKVSLILRWIESKDFQNALCYCYWTNEIAAAFAYAKERLTVGSPRLVISRAHRYDLYEDIDDVLILPFRHLIYSNLDCIFSVSRHGCDYLSHRYPLYKSKFFVSRLGVNVETPSVKPPTDGIWRLVSCSDMLPRKQVRKICDLVIAVARIRPHERFEWHHFGDGPELDAVNKALAQAPDNLSAHLPGRVQNCVVREFYKNVHVDMFISLSISEGIPVAAMEAIACCIPVVITPVGGVLELVDLDSAFILSPYCSLEEATQVLVAALNDREGRAARSVAAYRRLVDSYDCKTNYDDFYTTLKALFFDNK